MNDTAVQAPRTAEGEQIVELLSRQNWAELDPETAGAWSRVSVCLATMVEAMAEAGQNPELPRRIVASLELFGQELVEAGRVRVVEPRDRPRLRRYFENRFSDGLSVHLQIGAAIPKKRIQTMKRSNLGAVVTAWPEPRRGAMLVGPMSSLAFADASIDRIEQLLGLETAAAPLEVLAEFHRVLRPGGAVHVRLPLGLTPGETAAADTPRLTPAFLASGLAEAGFEKVAVASSGGPLRAMYLFFNHLDVAKNLSEDDLRDAAVIRATVMALLGGLMTSEHLFAADQSVGVSVDLYARKTGEYRSREDRVALNGEESAADGLRALLPILRCPRTGAALTMAGDRLIAADGGLTYRIGERGVRFDRPDRGDPSFS